ncbi:MAG: formate/nitrite transporter family protein [Acidobacteriota bacterium]|jgi:formate/nitrite transporter|nr:formate/nitrite transporter family protein [Acidobacteriota bacterium]
MNLRSPAEAMELYIGIGAKKTLRSSASLIVLGVLAGFLIGMSGVAAATVSYAIENPSLARLVSGMVFPFGLGIVLMTGAELWTGNSMMTVCVAAGRAKCRGMFRNWACVYAGNFAGAAALAAACAFAGQFDYGGGPLAVHTIQLAAFKCDMNFVSALILGFLCNILVCIAVIGGTAARDVIGRVAAVFLPISFFVIGGLEHCEANMYLISAGRFARLVPGYEAAALAAGVDLAPLTWGRFLYGNLLPVTLGNLLGGMAIAFLLWRCHGERSGAHEKTP